MIYRDAVERVSIRQVRASFSPREFAVTDEVRLEAAGTAATIKIAKIEAPTAFGGTRRTLLCPACGRPTNVVGLVTGDAVEPRWSCYRCTNWVSRKVPKAVRRNA